MTFSHDSCSPSRYSGSLRVRRNTQSINSSIARSSRICLVSGSASNRESAGSSSREPTSSRSRATVCLSHRPASSTNVMPVSIIELLSASKHSSPSHLPSCPFIRLDPRRDHRPSHSSLPPKTISHTERGALLHSDLPLSTGQHHLVV